MNAQSKAYRALLVTRRLAILLMVLESADVLLERMTGTELIPTDGNVWVASGALLLGLFSVMCDRIDNQLRRRSAHDRSELDGRELVDRQHLAASDARRIRVEWALEAAGVPEMAFQPIAELASGTVLGYEALARFPGGRPDEWFAEAAAVGLGIELELKAVRAALASLDQLPSDAYLSLNASPGTLLDRDFTKALLGVDSRRLVVELTEHVAIEDYRAIREVVSALRDHGIRLAVDDVGAGYSSLRHIALLEPDIIKIDRSFTHALTSAAGDRSVVSALVGFGQAMGAVIIAEGIEDERGLNVARELGVHAGQGWHIGLPVSPSVLHALPRPRTGRESETARTSP